MLVKAVAPFSISWPKSAADGDLIGDRPGIVFLELLAQRLSPVLEGHETALDASTLQTVIDETLEEVLKRDLALRLAGLLQPVKPHSMAQLAFLNDLLNRDYPLVLGLGPTGTGKTYLAIAAALNQLAKGAVKRIVITKPHEMLRGELMTQAKRAEKERDEQFEVYFDVLNDLVGHDEIQSLIDHRHLEITPLGLLRGRTLSDAFIVIDEAQNTDKHWMRLAITRAGQNSRTIITGDPSQSSLPTGEINGLFHLLKMIEGRHIGRAHKFQPKDIVRNSTVAQLEALYADAGLTDVEIALQRD
ncbi:MAG: PhoH family protein [Alphaproteobacteria bacterium]|nr:PhoH family protein [Alphaproteobacteria bacterium]